MLWSSVFFASEQHRTGKLNQGDSPSHKVTMGERWSSVGVAHYFYFLCGFTSGLWIFCCASVSHDTRTLLANVLSFSVCLDFRQPQNTLHVMTPFHFRDWVEKQRPSLASWHPIYMFGAQFETAVTLEYLEWWLSYLLTFYVHWNLSKRPTTSPDWAPHLIQTHDLLILKVTVSCSLV